MSYDSFLGDDNAVGDEPTDFLTIFDADSGKTIYTDRVGYTRETVEAGIARARAWASDNGIAVISWPDFDAPSGAFDRI